MEWKKHNLERQNFTFEFLSDHICKHKAHYFFAVEHSSSKEDTQNIVGIENGDIVHLVPYWPSLSLSRLHYV